MRLLQLDLDVDTRRQVELHQCIDRLVGRINDVHQALKGAMTVPERAVGPTACRPLGVTALRNNLRDHAGADGPAAFANRKTQAFFHGDRVDQLYRDRHVVAWHHHFFAFFQFDAFASAASDDDLQRLMLRFTPQLSDSLPFGPSEPCGARGTPFVLQLDFVALVESVAYLNTLLRLHLMRLRSCYPIFAAFPLLVLEVPSAVGQPQAQVNGPIELHVDATDSAHKLLIAHESIPVTAGTLSLSFAQWLPGTHSAEGKIDRLTGLVMHADGKVVEWVRDELEPFRFTLDVPAGATRLDVDLTYVTPVDRDKGRVFIDQNVTEVEWEDVILYPSGINSADIAVRPRVKLPDGYQFASALEVDQQADSEVTFKPTTLETLIDSPLMSGRFFKRYSLAADGQVPVHLDLVADRPQELEASAEALAQHRALVSQAALLFGTTHYAHYDFLLSVSDQIGGIGLEHHQSSEDGTGEGYFTEYATHWDERGLLPHEYVHSWNGKYRRPADLSTPNFNVPMGGSLLWVYEGQTDYWGIVLTSRAAMENAAQAHDYFAQAAASVDRRPGRNWRNLEDTTRSGAMGGDSNDWRSWQRYAGDYYREMDFVWMQVDVMIRKDTANQKSLDTFAKLFFGQEPGQRKVTTYQFDDIVNALHTVDPKQDWSAFLHSRLDAHSGHPAEEALRAAGWEIEYTDQDNLLTKAREHHARGGESINLVDSIGLSMAQDGRINEVEWDGAAFKAGAVVGLQVIAVNGEALSKELIVSAMQAAKTNSAPIALLVKNGTSYRTLNVDYHDGPRWPHLVRIAGSTDYLSAILAPR